MLRSPEVLDDLVIVDAPFLTNASIAAETRGTAFTHHNFLRDEEQIRIRQESTGAGADLVGR
jgi:hypothetical protein